MIISGPFFGRFITSGCRCTRPAAVGQRGAARPAPRPGPGRRAGRHRDDLGDPARDTCRPRRRAATCRGGPRRFGPPSLTILLPVVLMLVRAVGELTLDEDSRLRTVLDFVGSRWSRSWPACWSRCSRSGRAPGINRGQISARSAAALPADRLHHADRRRGRRLQEGAGRLGRRPRHRRRRRGTHISALLLGWLVAVGIRLATGSATVATVTAAGIVAPLGATLDQQHLSLLVLAIGAGSLFFSHVNDAGFWLVKEYFGLTVGQTIKSLVGDGDGHLRAGPDLRADPRCNRVTEFPEPRGSTSDSAQLFPRYLDFYRETVLRKVALPVRGRPARVSRLPSGWTPLELLVHLAFMERRWFVWGFLGEEVDEPVGRRRRTTDGRCRPAGHVVRGGADAARRRGAHATRAEPHTLDEQAPPGPRFEGEPATLAWICFHVLQEYARHAGHLDIAVELAGGEVGE